MRGDRRKINERFTDLADRVSEGMGDWRTSAAAVVLLVVWIGLGPIMRYSDTWQLAANTPTTWAELFIGFLLAAATNRSERHGRKLMERMARMEKEHGEQLAALHEINREQLEILRALGATKPANGRHAVRGEGGRYVKKTVD